MAHASPQAVSPPRLPGAGPPARLTSVEAALACYDANVPALGVETVPVASALGRVLAATAQAQTDLPAFSQTAVDGYALRAEDTAAARADRPLTLAVAGEVAAGSRVKPPPLAPGQALRIFTGAPLPPDCDAVVRQEQVVRGDGVIQLVEPVPAGRDIRCLGEELRRGANLGAAGRRLTPGLLAALAMAGVDALTVRRRSRIRVLVTGDEVAPAGRPLRPGEIRDANGPLIRAWFQAQGCPVPEPEYVADDTASVEAALTAAFDNADLVITSGGVSVGDRDYIPTVAERVGAEPLFWKVAQKPGKPLFFARRNGHFLLGLPGNPAAVLIGLVVHVRRVLDRLEGCHRTGPIFHPGQLAAPLKANATRAQFVRARREFSERGVVLHPLAKQGSHMLSNLAEADALVRVPAGDRELQEGSVIQWTPL